MEEKFLKMGCSNLICLYESVMRNFSYESSFISSKKGAEREDFEVKLSFQG